MIRFKFSVASISDWPPDKKVIPGTSFGTDFLRHSSVLKETSSLEILFFDLFPARIIFGFKIIPVRSILWIISSSKHFWITSDVLIKQSSAECSPSIKTSGSTIGTIPLSWTKAEYLARACAFELIASLLGFFSLIL